MKIGILYICTGEYWKFWQNFYTSAEQYFLTDYELNYFVFTDNDNLLKIKDKNIHPIYQEKMDWPYPTLFRFKTFYDNKDAFYNMDYLIFCNANLLFVKHINFIELFDDKKMFGTIHPGYFDKSVILFPDEINTKSLAYINRKDDSQYVCGGFNGGEKKYFLNMIELLNTNTNNDLDNNIIALWHDESHFNSYVENNKTLFNIIDSGFCYPENRYININKRILVQDKDTIISITHKGLMYTVKYYIKKYLKLIKKLIMDSKYDN